MSRCTSHVERWLLARLPDHLRSRLRDAHAANKAIVRSMFWLVLFVVAAKGIAVLKEMAVAYRYGTSEVLEGYLLVFNLATWPVSLIFSVMNFVLVPMLVRLHASDTTENHHLWQRQVTTWVWLIAIAMTVLVALALPRLIERGWLGLTPAGRAAALELLPVMAAIVGLGIVAAWHACQLMSRQKHANTFLEAMPAFSIMIFVLLSPSDGASPLLWGTVIGFAAQAVLIAWSVRIASLPVGLAWPPGKPFDPDLASRTGWLLGAQLVMGTVGVVDQIILAHLPAGSLATYGYASRIMATVLTLSATVLGRALLPVLSSVADADEAFQITRRWSVRIWGAGVLVAALIMLTAQPVVEVLFQRGAFTAEDSKATKQLLILLSLQLPWYLAAIVWLQFAVARNIPAKLLWLAALIGIAFKLIVMISMIWGLSQGASGVAFGATGFGLAYHMALLWIARKRQNHPNKMITSWTSSTED